MIIFCMTISVSFFYRFKIKMAINLSINIASSVNQDFQLWCDLRAFEQRMGSRYLTHEGDEERWRRYAQERALVFPPQLCCDAGSSRPV